MGSVVDLAQERAAHHARRDAVPAPEPVLDLFVTFCLEKLRGDPNYDCTRAFNEVKAMGWTGARMNFNSGPWRRAKMIERRERTGSFWHAGKHPGVRKKVEEPAPAPQVETAAVELPARGDGGVPLIDYRTTVGSVTVRPEGGQWRMIYSARLDRRTIEHLLPLLTAMLQANVLTGED